MNLINAKNQGVSSLILLIFLSSLLTLGGCSLADPQDLHDKQRLYDEPVDVVTGNGIQYAVVGNFLTEHGIDQMVKKVEGDIERYALCTGREPSALFRELRDYKFIIVPTTFKCFNKQHHGRCHGYYSNNPKMVVLARERPATGEFYPLTRHEVAHQQGDYNTDHSDLSDRIRRCIEYE